MVVGAHTFWTDATRSRGFCSSDKLSCCGQPKHTLDASHVEPGQDVMERIEFGPESSGQIILLLLFPSLGAWG